MHHLAVDPGLQQQALAASWQFVGSHQYRPERAGVIEILANGPLRRNELVVTHRPFVEQGVAGDVLQCIFLANVTTTAFEDHGHFAFVVEGVGNTRANQRFVVGGQAGVPAREQGRVARLGVRRLLGVVGVVQAHTHDLGRARHQWQVSVFGDLDQRTVGTGAVSGQVDAAGQ
ncbi:hypothetical protein D9M71_680460 [compost metagenome]